MKFKKRLNKLEMQVVKNDIASRAIERAIIEATSEGRQKDVKELEDVKKAVKGLEERVKQLERELVWESR